VQAQNLNKKKVKHKGKQTGADKKKRDQANITEISFIHYKIFRASNNLSASLYLVS